MNIKRHSFALPVVLCVGALCFRAFPSNAQTTAPQVKTDAAARQLVTVPLRFVPAHMMAYWLDPEHTPMPPEVVLTNSFQGQNPHYTLDYTPPVVTPAEDWVQADDGANQLLVYGTPQWIAKVRENVTSLDVRQPLISLNTRVVRISARERQALKIAAPEDFKGQKAQRGSTYLMSKGASILADIDQLVAQGRASIEGSSEHVLTNNLAASLLSASAPLPPRVTALAPQGIRTNTYNIFGLPTINNDDTITIVLNAWKGYNQDLALRNSRQIIAIAREGDTVILPLDDSNPEEQIILLITPHALRMTDPALKPAVVNPVVFTPFAR